MRRKCNCAWTGSSCQAAYVRGNLGVNGCSQGLELTDATCQQAAASLGRKWKGTKTLHICPRLATKRRMVLEYFSTITQLGKLGQRYPPILLIHIGGHLTPPGWIDRYGFALLLGYVFEAFCNITEIYKLPSEQIHISRFDRWFWGPVIELGSSILVV